MFRSSPPPLDLQNPAGTTLVSLTWSKAVVDGDSAPATGSFTLATGSLAGQSLCAGAGTQVHLPKDQTRASIQFVITGLTSGGGCTEMHTGTLQGCMN